MGLQGIVLSGVSQRKVNSYDFIYMWNLKKNNKNRNKLINTEKKGINKYKMVITK